MIRDPSDGSVRNRGTNTHGCDDMIISPETSGLPLESQKPDRQARLEKSREWLKNYFHRKSEQGT